MFVFSPCTFASCSFITDMEVLRKKNNLIWYQMCIFLIRYCGKMLHSLIDLMNDLLKNIECGFKTKNIEDRLLSYECWKVNQHVLVLMVSIEASW